MADAAEIKLRWRIAGIALAATAALTGLDAAVEGPQSAADFAVDALEYLILMGSAGGMALLALRVQSLEDHHVALIKDLETARAEGEGWRREVQTHMNGIGEAIEKQFLAWGLTEAEREVGLLMLKGFAHKDIAALRGTTQATVRQQARVVYEKSGLAGRSAFAAYFMEDLMPPRGGAPVQFDGR